MKKKLFFLLSIFCLFFNSLIAVTYNSEPKIFIQELVDDAVKTLSDNSISQEEKNDVIKKIAIEEISKLSFINLKKLESFDTKFVKFAYVVPTVETIEALRFIEKELSKIENLYIAGRFGAGDYDNSDYALMSGYNIGNFLTEKINKDEFFFNKSKNKKNIIVG